MVNHTDGNLRCYLNLAGKAVSSKVQDLFDILNEILLEPIKDKDVLSQRLKEMLLEDRRTELEIVHDFVGCLRGEGCKLHDVLVGTDHDMPVVVGKLVHDHEAVLRPVQNKARLVLVRVLRQAEDTFVRLGTENVVNAPWCPQVFHKTSRCPKPHAWHPVQATFENILSLHLNGKHVFSPWARIFGQFPGD